jgi:hypothetical protein
MNPSQGEWKRLGKRKQEMELEGKAKKWLQPPMMMTIAREINHFWVA